jgi:hypothetical protein
MLASSAVLGKEETMALLLGINEDYRDAIERAQQITGIDGSAIAALIDAEAAKIKSGPNKGKWDRKSFNPGSCTSTMFRATGAGCAAALVASIRVLAAAAVITNVRRSIGHLGLVRHTSFRH